MAPPRAGTQGGLTTSAGLTSLAGLLAITGPAVEQSLHSANRVEPGAPAPALSAALPAALALSSANGQFSLRGATGPGSGELFDGPFLPATPKRQVPAPSARVPAPEGDSGPARPSADPEAPWFLPPPPEVADLILAGGTLGVAALDRAMDLLALPTGDDLAGTCWGLPWVGLACWGLGAAAAYEAARHGRRAHERERSPALLQLHEEPQP